jgi:hypothetical protein
MDKLTEEALLEMALKSIDNFGPATDLYHPEYGWILKDGVCTKEGERFYEDQRKRATYKR